MKFYDQQTRTNFIISEIALIAVGYFAYSFFNHTTFTLAYRTTTEYQTTKQNLYRSIHSGSLRLSKNLFLWVMIITVGRTTNSKQFTFSFLLFLVSFTPAIPRTPINKYGSRTRLNAIKAFSLFPCKNIIAGRLMLELDTRPHCATIINYVEGKKPVEERRSRI